jgi:hypothetical protein
VTVSVSLFSIPAPLSQVTKSSRCDKVIEMAENKKVKVKSRRLQVRLSEADHDLIAKAAKKANIDFLGDFIRKAAVEVAKVMMEKK